MPIGASIRANAGSPSRCAGATRAIGPRRHSRSERRGRCSIVCARGPARARILVGFDFPIGLPRRYARSAGIQRFLDVLPCLGQGRWTRFFDVARTPGEITVERPFYPNSPGKAGGVSRRQLIDGLGLAATADLFRDCDRATGDRPPACPLFWTLGPQQVGKAAICGWREVLVPALRAEPGVALWPFHGTLDTLLTRQDVVLAETYPAEAYRHLGVGFAAAAGGRRAGKRIQAARAANARALRAWARAAGVTLDEPLAALIEDGFGPAALGEDPFDATLGLLGMLNVVLGLRPAGDPLDPTIAGLEGWILGQQSPGG